MKSLILSLITFLSLTIVVQAQNVKGRLEIQFNKNILQPGDSLVVALNYIDSSSQVQKPSLATVELIVENEEGQRTRLRWPVINGQASGVFYLPDSLARGKYTLLAGLQQRFFEVIGKIQDSRNSGSIQAMILTKTGEWDQQEVSVTPDGNFTINNWLFEDDALVAFSATGNNNQPLNVRISTQLDSSYRPIAVAGRAFYIGNPPPAVRANLTQSIETSDMIFADEGSLLPAVVVRGTTKSRAQQFNEEYVSNMFRSGNERLISIMDDPTALALPNIFSYLQGRVAGLQISPAGFNGGVARWRGGPVTFFLDEMRVSPQQIATIPTSDIAIVKAYPPPFFGAPGGGGGVAIYTRRGGESRYLPSNKQVFKVKGYTPSAVTLNMNKLSL